MKRVAIVLFQVFIGFGPVLAQSLKRPSVTEPSLKVIKIHKYHLNAPGSMGLFDWNFSGGYIDKTATVTSTSASPVDIATTGQYLMFHLQESVLSNYFLAKRSRRYKRFKIGFQNTIDLGIKRGAAADETSDYSLPSTAQQGTLKVFLNYQAGIATALRITSNLDVGYTYYFYVRSIFSPNTESYSKARLRVGHFMGEYSFGGMNAAELKYIHSRKVYYGLGYTKYNAVISNTSMLSSDIHTNWYHVSIGRVF